MKRERVYIVAFGKEVVQVDPIDLGLALDLVETGIVVQDSALRIVWVNRYAADVLGASREDLVDLTSHDPRWDATHPDGSPFPGETHPAAMAIRTGEPVRGAIMGVARPRSRERIWLLVTAIPAKDEEGRVVGSVTSLTNISAARSAQADLEELNAHLGRLIEERTHDLATLLRRHRESEELHRAVIHAMAEGIVVHDLDGSIRDANPAAEAILGLSFEQMQGRHPVHPDWGLTDADDRPLPPAEIPSEVTRRTGNPVSGRLLQVLRPGGEKRWLSVSTQPIRIEGESEIAGVVATFNDVTPEQNAQLALERNRTFLERVMASVPGVLLRSVWSDDGDNRITFVSEDVEPLLGLSAQAIMEDPGTLYARIHPDDVPILRAERARMVSEEVASSGTIRFQGPDQQWRWIRIHSAPPAKTEEGTVFHATLLDITEERRMEQVLRIAQRQEAIGVLAGGIAHNFNNMLAVILPSLELASELGGPEVAEALSDASRATRGASALVRQLLRLARREGSDAAEELDLGQIVDQVVTLARRIFSRRIRLDLDASEIPLPVQGRRDELEQVVLNLLINARDAVEGSDDPHIEVEIRGRGEEVVVEVLDNGCGMTPEVSRNLGQPFFTTKDPGRGTGLGLATALGIVADHDGRLEWHSPGPGQGATFTLSLALSRDPSTASDTQPAASPNATAEEVQGARVLIVDDEPMVLKSVVRLLRKLVPEITTAPDGEEALRILDTEDPFDAVLVDFSMPGMDGGEFTRTVKVQRPDLPVLIMTGYVREPDQVAAADGVIQKPFSGAELRGALRPWLPERTE